MRKIIISTIAIPTILISAIITNVIFLPIPQGPIRACPLGAIWAVIWNGAGST